MRITYTTGRKTIDLANRSRYLTKSKGWLRYGEVEILCKRWTLLEFSTEATANATDTNVTTNLHIRWYGDYVPTFRKAVN